MPSWTYDPPAWSGVYLALLTLGNLAIWASYTRIVWLLWRWVRRASKMQPVRWILPLFATGALTHLLAATMPVWSRQGPLVATRVLAGLVAVITAVYLDRLLSRLSLPAAERGLILATDEVAAQALVDALGFAAVITSQDGGNLAINEGYQALLGVGIDDVRGYLWERHLHPQCRERAIRWWRDFAADRTSQRTHRFRWRHPVAGWTWICVTGHRLPDGRCWRRVEDASSRVEIEDAEAFRGS